MYSKMSYSSGSEDFRGYGDSKTGREVERPSFVSSLSIGPREDKIEREIYPTKEASNRVSENTTKSFVTRSVIDKRSTSSYRTSEKVQSVKSRDLPGYSGNDAVRDPISSFYTSYSKDEDLSDAAKAGQPANKSEDVISSFYQSSVGLRKARSVDRGTKIDEKIGGSTRATSSKASATELHAARGVSWRTDKSTEPYGSLKRRGSLPSLKETDKENGDPKTITSENINILRRALERKEASNSLEREKLSKKFSKDDSIDLSKYTSNPYRKTTLLNTSKPGKDIVDGRETFEVDAVMNGKASDWGIFPKEIKARSRSTESLNEKERSRSGIYREVPERSEVLSYSRSLSNIGITGSDDDRRFSREGRRTGSLDRHAGSVHRRDRDDHSGGASSLSRVRSRSSEELRPSYDDEEVYPSYRSRTLHRQDREGSFDRDETSRRYLTTREISLSTRDKLREDIARLKAEAESRTAKKDVKLYSFSREPTIHDKLKEDIAKLKAETLTRDRVKPYVPPASTRVESVNISSRWRSREPSVQDRLKEDIARLKAETEKIPSFPKGTSGVTTEIIIPDRRMEEIADVRHSGISRTSVERYNVSNKDGDVFKDVSRSEETKRFGDAKNPEQDEISRRRSSLRIDSKPNLRDELKNVEKAIRDKVVSGPSADYFHPFSDGSIPSSTRTNEEAASILSARPILWPKENGIGFTERDNFVTTPRDIWNDPTQTSRSSKFHTAEAYASKQAFRADSNFSISSNKDAEGGPGSTQGYFRGSLSKESRSAYYSREMDDKENGYRDITSVPDFMSRRSHEETPKPAAVPRPRDNAIPLPYSGYDSVSHGRKDPSLSLKGMQGEPGYKDRRERDERQSVRVHSDSEFVTRKTIRDDSVISRKRYEADNSRSLSSKVESPRCIPERSKPSPRRKSTRDDEHISEENKTRFCEEIDAPLPGYKEIKTSPVISELRKKIDQLKDKVDTLDDRRAKMNLERYVDDHSERKTDVDIKPPVHIKRYQLTERKPDSGSEVDGPDSHTKRESITSETISRQISRQTSEARTLRQTGSIQEDVRKQQFHGEEVISPTSKPDQKPTVTKQMCDAQTMTPPDVQQHVGNTVIQRQDSILDERDRLKELRGIPIDHGRRTAQIEEVGRGQEKDTGVTMIQVEQQTISPKKNVQEWWNAFTAEDVDRLLELGNWSPWNAYTAEDADRMFYLGPVRRRSFRRSSLRRYPKIRQYKDDPVDVLVRVRGRQEKRRRPQCIIAQAAPQEKAIVLRETKETTEPYIRKIKVDDVYGADAVRVENGVVKIKIGDKGRKTWARILQKKDHIVESDGTVIVPVSGDQYEDGMYYSSCYKGQQQDGKAVRTPIKFKIQEQNAVKSNKIRVARETRKTGSMRRRRKAAARSLCPYIVGARYYNGKIMLTCADANRSQARAQSGHREIVIRQPQSNSQVTGNEIVLRRSSQPPAFPVKTIQRIHEGHKTTSHAATTRSEDGKMIITVHAAPPRPPHFSLKQAGQNMTSSSYYDNTSQQRDVSSASGNYFVSSTSGPQGYVTSSRPGRHGKQGTSYYVTDPSDSFGRRSGYHSVSRYHSSNERSSTPTIVPYEDGTSQIGTQNGSFIANPSSYYGFYNAPGSRLVPSDPRLNASTGYGEKFDLRDHGGLSSVRYVNGARQGSRIINERMKSNGHYRYGSSWNSRQQDTLNGRSMSWAVEEVAPDF